jgi:hypothetical protein
MHHRAVDVVYGLHQAISGQGGSCPKRVEEIWNRRSEAWWDFAAYSKSDKLNTDARAKLQTAI